MNGSKRLSPQDVADGLRERIKTGELKPGDRLPTQAVLVDEFGVDRSTVRQALRLLQEKQLLTNVSRGSPPRIAERAAAAEQPPSRAARVVLASYLVEAFRASEVRIDALCFTAETLLLALGEPLRRIHAGEMLPESIEVRCLLPGPKAPLPYPEPVDRPELTERVHERLREQIRQQRTAMEGYLANLKRYQGIDTKVTFRELLTVPPVKQYVLNGTLALHGNYKVGIRLYDDLPGEEAFEVSDVGGFASTLFEFRKERGGQDAAMAEDIKNCFDALWESRKPRQTLGR
ncbi:MAG: GntR family transcriptional regulator [Streptomyces sp.]|nr:GntR family transcriptional regulator [Streptomyces sp.]